MSRGQRVAVANSSTIRNLTDCSACEWRCEGTSQKELKKCEDFFLSGKECIF